MRTEPELTTDIDRAKQANSIVNHPLFIAAIEDLHNVTIETFKSLSTNSVEEMQKCNIRLELIDEFKDNFYSIITAGNAAFQTLEDLAEFKKATKQ